MHAYAYILTHLYRSLENLKNDERWCPYHPIGTKISKTFYEGVFQGEISKIYHPEIGDTSLWYEVSCQDGDYETMDEQEILPLISKNNGTTKLTSAAASAPIADANASTEGSVSASTSAIPACNGGDMIQSESSFTNQPLSRLTPLPMAHAGDDADTPPIQDVKSPPLPEKPPPKEEAPASANAAPTEETHLFGASADTSVPAKKRKRPTLSSQKPTSPTKESAPTPLLRHRANDSNPFGGGRE